LHPSADNHIDADKFVEFLSKSSLKGLLPNLQKILVTTYSGHSSIDSWIIQYIWSQVFVKRHEYGIFNGEGIKLIQVNGAAAK